MKKLIIASLALLLAAWSYPPSGNMPKSSSTVATAGAPIPTAFSSSDSKSLVLQGASGLGYSHLMVLNNTGSSVALALSPYVSPRVVPGDTGSSVLYVLPNTNAAWDDISVFDEIYIRSNKGATITSGNVDVMVW